MISIKEMAAKPVKLTEGHRLCAGCSEPIVAKQVLLATDKPVVVSNATGCFEVSTSGYPYSSWTVPRPRWRRASSPSSSCSAWSATTRTKETELNFFP